MAKFGASFDVGSFSVLGKVLPPTAVVHVGAGYGRGWLHQWRHWNVPTAWVIDADESRLGWVSKLGVSDQGKSEVSVAPSQTAEGQGIQNADESVRHTQDPSKGLTNLHLVAAVVGEASGEAIFYEASNPEESSLVSPTDLKDVWPNLRVVSEQGSQIKPLDDLILNSPAGAWLLLDCLPALPILKGASKVLASAQIVVARVLLQPEQIADGPTRQANRATGRTTSLNSPVGEGVSQYASVQELRELEKAEQTGVAATATEGVVTVFLNNLGFRVVDRIPSHHPSVGHLVFAKSYSVVDRQEREEQRASDQQAYAALEDQHVALQSSEAMLQQQVRELAAAVSQAKSESQVRESIAAQLHEEKKLNLERQAQIDELTKSLQVEAQRVKDLAAKLDIMGEEKAELVKHRDDSILKFSEAESDLALLINEKSTVVKKCQEQATQIEKLISEIATLKQSVEVANKEQEAFKQSTQKEHETAVQSLNTKHQEAVTKLQQQLDAVQREHEVAKKSVTQLQQQVKDLESVRAESNKLKAENDELHQRQLLMNEELVKAEGQITLIKDLLLREQGM